MLTKSCANVISINSIKFWLLLIAPIFLRVHATEEHFHHLSEIVNLGSSLLVSSSSASQFSRSYGRRESPSASPSNSSGSSDDPSSSLLINEVPRVPVWNGAPFDNDQRHIDFSHLFELMGEPRGSRGRELSELITRPRPKCNRRIPIQNGVTRIRERGSLARFQCSHGFTLIGPTTIVCLRDRWSEPPPICVKSGCRPLRRPQYAEMRQSIGGAVAAFYCMGNTKLLGNPVIFCDGIRWNGTEPTCYAKPLATTTQEPDSDESWPVSVGTPAPWNSNVGSTDQDSNWDNNLHPLFQESTTEIEVISSSSSPPEFVHETESHDDESGTTTIVNIHQHPTIHSPVEHITSEPVTQSVHPPKFPEPEMKTEKQQEGPAPITTSQPFILTHEMGQSERSQPITPVVAPETTLTPLVPLPAPHLSLPQTKLPPPSLPSSGVIISVTTSPTISTTTTTRATPTTAIIQVTYNPLTPPRRFKIITRRPRRTTTTRRPTRRPLRRRTTTTTVKPRRRKNPTTPRTSSSLPKVLTSSPLEFQQGWDSPAAPTSIDYPIAIDRAFLPREQVEPIRPIYPDMLNNNGGDSAYHGEQLSHASMIIGIVLVVLGLSTFSAGVFLYCWRKNKGIARARPYDLDGRTLSAHDANDDFMWMDQRDSRL